MVMLKEDGFIHRILRLISEGKERDAVIMISSRIKNTPFDLTILIELMSIIDEAMVGAQKKRAIVAHILIYYLNLLMVIHFDSFSRYRVPNRTLKSIAEFSDTNEFSNMDKALIDLANTIDFTGKYTLNLLDSGNVVNPPEEVNVFHVVFANILGNISILVNRLANNIKDSDPSSFMIMNIIHLIERYDQFSKIRSSTRISVIFRQETLYTLDYLFQFRKEVAEVELPIVRVVIDVLWGFLVDSSLYLTLQGTERIETATLLNKIAPYLQALRDVQFIHSNVVGVKVIEPRVIQIHNEAPKIEIIGIADALRAISEITSFTKRKQDEKLRNIAIERDLLALEREKADTDAHIRQIELEKLADATERELQIAKLREELKQIQLLTKEKELELEERRWKLEQEQMRVFYNMAIEILKMWKPDAEPSQVAMAIPQLARALKRMSDTELTLRLGWHDNPPPPPEI